MAKHREPGGREEAPLLLKDKAYRSIKQGILQETFQAGQFLSEKQLIDHLAMSKTPIKSALDRLEAEGFVQVSPKQGILVKELSYEKVKHLFDLRLALELFVAEQVAGRLSPLYCEKLELNLADQRRFMKEQDNERFTVSDAEFHMLLCEATGNKEIISVMENNQSHLYRFALRVIRRLPERKEQAYRDHVNILAAAKANQPEEMKQLIRDHLQYAKTFLTI
ncbi:GntR family transcriptional regulator [Paenibacillus sp. 1P07SE]|uniref:GntR family transcriptional regulator n=1 Tax=Paenibacillus sp. 1P07SE TaxID=3132209 RepID=UPI0039A53B6A